MKKSEENNKKEKKSQSKYLDIWEVLKIRKEKGLWNGEIKVHEIKEYNLNKGDHYFIIEDLKKRSVKCISCPISHGGILESHLLTRYTIENGVIKKHIFAGDTELASIEGTTPTPSPPPAPPPVQ